MRRMENESKIREFLSLVTIEVRLFFRPNFPEHKAPDAWKLVP